MNDDSFWNIYNLISMIPLPLTVRTRLMYCQLSISYDDVFDTGKKRTRSRQIPSYHDPLRLVKKNILLNMAYMSIILLLETVVNPMLRIQPNLARLSNQSQRRPGCGACYTIIFFRIFTVLFCFILFYFFFGRDVHIPA